jgi:hypothetical protein
MLPGDVGGLSGPIDQSNVCHRQQAFAAANRCSVFRSGRPGNLLLPVASETAAGLRKPGAHSSPGPPLGMHKAGCLMGRF